MKENWNAGITEGITKADLRTEEEKKAAVIEFIKQNKGNLYIVTQTGMSYEEVRSIRRRYEKAHLSGN